jgi:hypothetical protein
MILDSKNNQFVFYFSPDFWCEKVLDFYKSFYKYLLLPYENVDDYVLSTLQTVEFPGITNQTVSQTRYLGKEMIYKGAQPVKDLQDKKFSLSFKMTEGFMNYMMIYHNYLEFMDHMNKKQNYDCFTLGVLNNEGFLMYTIDFLKVLPVSISSFNLDYTAVDNNLNKFTVGFKYVDWNITLQYDKMLNLYEES